MSLRMHARECYSIRPHFQLKQEAVTIKRAGEKKYFVPFISCMHIIIAMATNIFILF